VYVTKFGSDPLKTYLPDSDIDISLIYEKSFEAVEDADIQKIKLGKLDKMERNLKRY
jgi:hypothetical protein